MVDRLRAGRPFHNKTVAETVAEIAAEHEAKGIQCLLVIGFDADGDFYARSARLSRANALWLIEAARDDVLHGDTTIGMEPINLKPDDDGRKVIKFDGEVKEKKNAE